MASCSQRPINNITKERSRSDDNDQIAIAAGHKIFHSADFCQIQLFTEPDHARSHERAALRALRETAVVMLLMLPLVSLPITTRTARHENISMNLYDLVAGDALLLPFGTPVKVIHVLGHEQKFACPLR